MIIFHFSFPDVYLLANRLVAQWLQIVKSPAAVLQHPTIDTSHLTLDPHHSLERDMLPQTAQMQMLEESREDDGHFNFHFPTDSNMQLDIANDLYCDPTDITFDTISKDDLLPASANLCEYRTDNCNSTMISNGTDLGEIHTEFSSDLVSVNEVKTDPMQEMNFESVVEPSLVSEVTPVPVNEETELMDTDSAVVTNGEPQEKLVLKLSGLKDGKKIIVKSPTKRKLSEDEEESSPAKRKAREVSKDKKREKEKSDKSSHKHDKTDKKSSSSSSSERRSSKDLSKDSHKSESRHSDSKSRHHHHSDKSKDKSRDKDKDRSKSSSSSSSSKDKEKERERAKLREKEKKLKEKEKAETQAEKDKATLAKIMQPSVTKLGKIPKKSDSSSKSGDKVHPPVLADTKKISISIENRKQSGEPRPKTVKTPPTKFRSTGLEDVVKPPPSRKDIKKPAAGAPLPGVKETNPLLNVPVLPERRTKPVLNMSGPPERPGAIKLIPAKPKCEYLVTCITLREIIFLAIIWGLCSVVFHGFFTMGSIISYIRILQFDFFYNISNLKQIHLSLILLFLF